LRERLARDPDQYGGSDLRVVPGRAAVGVGRRLVTVTKEREGVAHTSHRALVLDHGFVPGHEDDYRELLLEWAAVLGARGATHLAVFTSEHAPTHDAVVDLAEEVETFDFWAFDLPAPASFDGGFYVDPAYF
jgi:hypothetical protein